MTTIAEYANAVENELPRWLPGREDRIADLRAHLSDRVTAGEAEASAVASMEPPKEYAAALLGDIELKPAPHGRRIGAFLVDILLGLPLAFGAFALLWLIMSANIPDGAELANAENRAEFLRNVFGGAGLAALFFGLALLSVSALLMSIFYFPLLEAVWGTTVGKHLFGLCIAVENGTRVTWLKAFVRRIPFYFEFFWLDALVVFFTRRRQRAFDYVAKTVVIVRPR